MSETSVSRPAGTAATGQSPRRAHQQEAVAILGAIALRGVPLSELFDAAVTQVTAALDNEFSKLLRLTPAGDALELIAGTGWRPGLVGSATVEAGRGSQAGFTLAVSQPVVVTDLRTETRFRGSKLLVEHQVVSGLSIVIGPPERPWGVLGTHSRQRKSFSADDINFFTAIAHLLWTAIARQEQEVTIRRQLTEISTIYDHAPIGLCVHDRDLRFVRINDQLAAMNGRTVDEHLGRRLSDILPEFAAQVEPILETVLQTGEPVQNFEVQGTTPAAPHNRRDWLASYFPLRTDDRIVGVNAVIRDVTRQKVAERELRERNITLEEQLRRRIELIELLHGTATDLHEVERLEDAVAVVLQRVARFADWDYAQAFQIRSEHPEDLVPIGTPWTRNAEAATRFRAASERDVLPRDRSLPGAAVARQRAIRTDTLNQPIDDLRHPLTESESPLTTLAVPVTVGGRPQLVLEFIGERPLPPDERTEQLIRSVRTHLSRTVERLRSATALRESEGRFRELAESTGQIFWVLDASRDELIYVSPAWSSIVGQPAPAESQPHPQHWRRYVHPDDRDWVDHAFRENATRGRYDVVYRIVRESGEVRWIHDVAVPIRDEVGSVVRILGVAADVTERRELEREIAAAATHEQKRLSRDLHDSIGQELTGLTMMAGNLAQQLQRAAPEVAAGADSLVEGLKRTLQQVRRISRGLAPVDIEAGGLTVALAQLAEQTSLAATSECVFRCEHPVRIANPAVASHLYRIAQEAVSNAVKHAGAHTISIGLQVDGGFCELSIEDDGCGMPADPDPRSEGMGQKIMRYRSDLIGGRFRIDRAASGGTRVLCQVRQDEET